MKNNNFKKYKSLDDQYFSNDCGWEFTFEIDSIKYFLEFDFENQTGYFFYKENEWDKKVLYKNIYIALDEIKFKGKSLRWMLINTDFDFIQVS